MAGSVLDPQESPIFNAEVWLPTLKRSARSDSLGHFRIDAIPTGSHLLIVRRLGYEPMSAMLNVKTADRMDVEFLLQPAYVILDNVKVTATKSSMRLAEFDARRKTGAGQYLTADYFAKNFDRNMGDILSSKLAGVRTVGGGMDQIVVSTRMGSSCAVQVILNGAVYYNGYIGQPKFDVNSVRSADVIGVEYYTTSTTPAQFGGTSGGPEGLSCGTLLIWTR